MADLSTASGGTPGVVLVTGAASGIGAATARRLADLGARALVLVDKNGPRLSEIGDLLDRPGLELLLCTQDIADETAWEDTEHRISHHWKLLDGVVVCAGIAESGALIDLSLEDWRHTMSVNLDGAFLSLRTGMRLLRDGGAAVVISSASAVKAQQGTAAYGASKAGLLQMARVAALEGAARGVRVNAILPGGVETPIWRGVPFFRDLIADTGSEQAAFAKLADMATPLGHYAKPEEIANQILFLLSDDARSITGAALTVDGGYTL